MLKNVKTLYMRNLLTIILIVLISHILLGIIFSVYCYNYMIKEKKDEMTAAAFETSRMVSAYSMTWEMDGLNMRMALTSFAEASNMDIILCDKSGVCVSCSDKLIDCSHIGKNVSQSIKTALNAESTDCVATIGDLGGILPEKAYFVGKAIPDFRYGGTIGYLFLVLNDRIMTEMWSEFILLYVMVTLFIIIIALILTRFVTKMQTMPIDEMAKAANKFAHGDFSARVSETDRKDEIGQLADAFNTMADSLEKSEMQRREFVANVSHELKTPMTTITGFADGILDGTIPQEKEREYLAMISSEAKRLSRLVRGMLDASRAQEDSGEDMLSKNFDIVEIVSVALLSLEQKITSRGLDVEVDMPEEALVVRGDKDAITQVVYNLFDNAAKFAEEKSVLRLEIWKEKNKVYVSVENRGETIDPSELKMIFDRFHKTDRSRSLDKDGVGLGLYIVKTILDRHGEDIFVESRDGVTKFIFSLTPVKLPPPTKDKKVKEAKIKEKKTEK